MLPRKHFLSLKSLLKRKRQSSKIAITVIIFKAVMEATECFIQVTLNLRDLQ